MWGRKGKSAMRGWKCITIEVSKKKERNVLIIKALVIEVVDY